MKQKRGVQKSFPKSQGSETLHVMAGEKRHSQSIRRTPETGAAPPIPFSSTKVPTQVAHHPKGKSHPSSGSGQQFRRDEESQAHGNVIGAPLGAKTPCHSERSLSKGSRRIRLWEKTGRIHRHASETGCLGVRGVSPAKTWGSPGWEGTPSAYDSQAQWARWEERAGAAASSPVGWHWEATIQFCP